MQPKKYFFLNKTVTDKHLKFIKITVILQQKKEIQFCINIKNIKNSKILKFNSKIQ